MEKPQIVNNLGNFGIEFNGDTGSSTFLDGQLDIVGGSNVTTDASDNIVTINCASNSGLFTWQTVTGATTLVAGNGYFVDGSSQVVFTLPLNAEVGDTFKICVVGPGPSTGWKITQNAGQNIVLCVTTGGNVLRQTTVGTGGSVTTPGFTNVDIVCQSTDTKFVLLGASIAVFTIV